MPTTNVTVSGVTYHKVVEPDIWVFESIAGMRAFPGPRKYSTTTDGDAPLAIILTMGVCSGTASVWAWQDNCSSADDGATIIMPTDQPLDGAGDPEDGRWVVLIAAAT